jgi:hypothetical protein
MAPESKPLVNYIAYIPKGNAKSRVGHLDLESNAIVPLSYVSGTPVRTLYEVIEAGEQAFVQDGEAFPWNAVKLLPPIYGRGRLRK